MLFRLVCQNVFGTDCLRDVCIKSHKWFAWQPFCKLSVWFLSTVMLKISQLVKYVSSHNISRKLFPVVPSVKFIQLTLSVACNVIEITCIKLTAIFTKFLQFYKKNYSSINIIIFLLKYHVKSKVFTKVFLTNTNFTFHFTNVN